MKSSSARYIRAEVLMNLYSLGEVARLVNVAPYRISYAISVGLLPDTALRFNNRRCFTPEDVELIACHFRTEIGVGEADARKEAREV
jgi:DNA-binding transcriptional MerR regulator